VGSRSALDAAERRELAAQFGLVVAPQHAQDVDPFVGAATAGVERHADGVVLAGHVAHPDTDDESSLREHVDCRQLLGQDDRVAQGKDDDAGPEGDA